MSVRKILVPLAGREEDAEVLSTALSVAGGGRGRGEREERTTKTKQAAMMSAGRPVLIAPKKAWNPVGGSVCIGWDDSAEAAHAVTAAIPFLEKAKKVTILCIGGKELDPGPGSTLADYLELHGVVADVHLVDAAGRAAGEVLLENAERAKTDLLVMGGYSHSRLREFIIGGTTQHIRSHATIPVLMAH